MDKDVINLAKAIMEHESGNKFDAKGASGEFGAAQWMPDTWKEHSIKTFGKVVDQTPDNQKAALYTVLKADKDRGLNPAQIAAKWNSGSPEGWEKKVGVNKFGVKYDVPSYVKKVTDIYQKNKSSNTEYKDTTAPQPTDNTSVFNKLGAEAAQDLKKDGFLNDANAYVKMGAASVGNELMKTGQGLNSFLGKISNKIAGTDYQTDIDTSKYDNNFAEDTGTLGKVATGLGTAFGSGGQLIATGGATKLALGAASKLPGVAGVAEKIAGIGDIANKVNRFAESSPVLGGIAKYITKSAPGALKGTMDVAALNTVQQGGDVSKLKGSDLALDLGLNLGMGVLGQVAASRMAKVGSNYVNKIKEASQTSDDYFNNIAKDKYAFDSYVDKALTKANIPEREFAPIVQKIVEDSKVHGFDPNRKIIDTLNDVAEGKAISSVGREVEKITYEGGGKGLLNEYKDLANDPSFVKNVDGTINWDESSALKELVRNIELKTSQTGKYNMISTINNAENQGASLASINNELIDQLEKRGAEQGILGISKGELLERANQLIDDKLTGSGIGFAAKRDFINGLPNVLKNLEKQGVFKGDKITYKSGEILRSIKNANFGKELSVSEKEIESVLGQAYTDLFNSKITNFKLDDTVEKTAKEALKTLGYKDVMNMNSVALLQAVKKAQSDTIGAIKLAEFLQGRGADVSRLFSTVIGGLGADGYNPGRFYFIKLATEAIQKKAGEAAKKTVFNKNTSTRYGTGSDSKTVTDLKSKMNKNNPIMNKIIKTK